jgi:flagellar biosynthesis component FlhA
LFFFSFFFVLFSPFLRLLCFLFCSFLAHCLYNAKGRRDDAQAEAEEEKEEGEEEEEEKENDDDELTTPPHSSQHPLTFTSVPVGTTRANSQRTHHTGSSTVINRFREQVSYRWIIATP